MSKNPKVESGEFSRESARVPVDVIFERLVKERDEITSELRLLQSQMSTIQAEMLEERSLVLKKRLPKPQENQAMMRISMETKAKKAEVSKKINAIEVRLADIKSKQTNKYASGDFATAREKVIAERRQAEHRDIVEVLGRIEGLLLLIVERLPKGRGEGS